MIIESAELDDNSIHDCDICIVGAGPAGLTIADALSRTSLGVNILESGGLATRSASTVETLAAQIGTPLDEIKFCKRYVGGGSNEWGGLGGRWFRQRPLDPLDFEERSWIQDSGWPISYDDLKPYYERACEVLNILPLRYFDPTVYKNDIDPEFRGEDLRTAIFQDSKPVRFVRHYTPKLMGSDTIRLFLNATVTNIEEAQSEPLVKSLEFQARNGKHHRVTARQFVLACGGLQVPRLLLTSTSKKSCGIGNEQDLVGRFFMQHPKGRHGLVCLHRRKARLPFVFHKSVSANVSIASGVTFGESKQRQLQVLNPCINFLPVLSLHEGAASDVYKALRHTWHSNHKLHDCVVEFFRNIRASSDVSPLLLRKYLGASNLRLILSHMEQAPNRDSRVFLSADKDELGQPKLHSDWRIGSFEKESLCRLHKLTKSTIERFAAGQMVTSLDADTDVWPISKDSAHYLGTTRMHESPRRGVTDKNGRIHSVENMYICGGSIFPTGGYANPTLTIIALAFRLADHLMELNASKLLRKKV